TWTRKESSAPFLVPSKFSQLCCQHRTPVRHSRRTNSCLLTTLPACQPTGLRRPAFRAARLRRARRRRRSQGWRSLPHSRADLPFLPITPEQIAEEGGSGTSSHPEDRPWDQPPLDS
ncbi:unnamed protein product, partial [Polarella glacialis]